MNKIVGEEITTIDHEEFNIDILSIVEDREGNLWIGTYGKGLIYYDPIKDSIEQYTTEDGVSDNSIAIVCNG